MINETIKKINEYLNQELWMDFELYKSRDSFLEVGLSGRIDELADEKIEIIFKEVFMINCRTLFTYEGGGDFIYMATTEKEESQIKKQYGVETFKLRNTNYETADMYIIANGIEVKIY